MREILFRGKRIDNGEWLSGDLRHYRNGKVGIHNDAMRFTEIVNPETVGQYIGLKDKNGRRIYEWDIVRYAEKCDYDCFIEHCEHPELYDGVVPKDYLERAVIKYGIEYDYPAFDIEPNEFETNGLSWIANDADWVIEVIGNIHDNGELIHEK